MKRLPAEITALLDLQVAERWWRLHRKRCRQLTPGLLEYLSVRRGGAALNPQFHQQILVDYLRFVVDGGMEQIVRLREGKRRFDGRMGRAAADGEKRALVLDYAQELGATARQLRADRRAFGRWFGEDAVRDRWETQVAEIEQRMAFALQRLGVITAHVLGQIEPELRSQRWSDLRFDKVVEQLFTSRAIDERIVLAGLDAIDQVCRNVPQAEVAAMLSQGIHQAIYRLALDADQPVWLQRRALRLLPLVEPSAVVKTLSYRLSQGDSGEDLFVRAGAVEVCVDQLRSHPQLEELLLVAARDDSPLVRQRVARLLDGISARAPAAAERLAEQLRNDPEPSVRGQLLLSLREVANGAPQAWMLEQLGLTLAGEADDFVYRVALGTWLALAAQTPVEEIAVVFESILEIVEERHQRDESLRIRRWSAQTREQYLAIALPDYREVLDRLQRARGEGHGRLDLRELPQSVSEQVLMRVFAGLVQEDFGVEADFRRRGKVRFKGLSEFGFRCWRALYEWRNPSTDKRQGIRHTVGRAFKLPVRAPSAILAEVSQTKVPGEPLIMPAEDGWRPYLPLVDECLAALQQEGKVQAHRIYTSEGVTEVVPPARLRGQLRAWWRLTRDFASFAEWRNWQDKDSTPAGHYVEQLRQLGFDIRFRAHTNPANGEAWQDDSVARFFSGLIPVPVLNAAWLDFKRHVVSVYENTVWELVAFVALVAGFFFGRHLLMGALMRRARNRIPLVVGGWGTRGKSGTERLKAAMFNAMGLSVFSKTTGCEAMFVMNRPFRRLRELFLFRPYDKATIWEQFNMVRLASRLDSDVFLWECMGLTPSYVRVLQRDWMRDDLSTITNTFPDHEDLQGPAGINIPQVMCEFIPPGGCLITTEEKMLPILRQDAQRKDTHLHEVNWLQAGLLTPDVLERFPYEEHPFNIALVLGLAKELDIEPDFALKEMADNVVMDLGVLKTYPTATVGNRQFEFIMGMSANERFGALNNWTRMGLADATLAAAPDTWISTLVNNRADRVPRSRVFADFLVKDISADQHVLIGTNLQGLRGYIEEAWQDHLSDFALWTDDADPADSLRSACRSLRVPVTQEELDGRLQALGGDDADDTTRWAELFAAQFAAYQQLQADLQAIAAGDAGAREAFDQKVRQQLWEWFRQKLVVVQDPHIDGDDLVQYIARHAPPYLRNRIMGMQNIKGTGLSFVYAWQSWEEQARLGQQLGTEDAAEFDEALAGLVKQSHFGVLAQQQLAAQIEEARHGPVAQRESAQAQLTALGQRLQVADTTAEAARVVAANAQNSERRDYLAPILSGSEAVLDAGDAVRRRRHADRVYRDLISASISEDRAIAEIKDLNKRQKGGWLRQRLGV